MTGSGMSVVMILSQTNRLEQCRGVRAWSQALLAEKSAVSRTEVSAIETGRLVPSVAVALRLAAALGASVEAIFGQVGQTPSVAWAWPPPDQDVRSWSARIGAGVLAYPVEAHAAGSV